MALQFAIKTELFAGRSGRPWREAVLCELRMMHRNILMALTGQEVSIPTGLKHLPPLDKSYEEVKEMIQEEENKESWRDSEAAIEEWLQKPDKLDS